jgi:hypothetical protein
VALITWEGSQPANQYLSPPTSHLVLSQSTLPDALLLAEHDNKPYEYYPTGWTTADGRSLRGAIRLKGDNWKKDIWECNFLVKLPQVTLFNQLLQAQQDSIPVTVVDRWIDGIVITKAVWLHVDRQYQTAVAANTWWRLQFQCWEV